MKTQSFEHVTLSHVNAADDEAIVAARVIATVLATDRMVARRVVCFELSFLSRAHARLLLIPCRLKSGRERRERCGKHASIRKKNNNQIHAARSFAGCGLYRRHSCTNQTSISEMVWMISLPKEKKTKKKNISRAHCMNGSHIVCVDRGMARYSIPAVSSHVEKHAAVAHSTQMVRGVHSRGFFFGRSM